MALNELIHPMREMPLTRPWVMRAESEFMAAIEICKHMRNVFIALICPLTIAGCSAINAYSMAANSMSSQQRYTHYRWWKPEPTGSMKPCEDRQANEELRKCATELRERGHPMQSVDKSVIELTGCMTGRGWKYEANVTTG